MTGWLFALGGAAAGAAQVGLLARSARTGAGPASFLARLLLVGAVLFLSARSGQVVPGAAGWGAGFAAAAALAVRRLP